MYLRMRGVSKVGRCMYVRMYIRTYVRLSPEKWNALMVVARETPLARTGGVGYLWWPGDGPDLWAGPAHGVNRCVHRCRGGVGTRERARPGP